MVGGHYRRTQNSERLSKEHAAATEIYAQLLEDQKSTGNEMEQEGPQQ